MQMTDLQQQAKIRSIPGNMPNHQHHSQKTHSPVTSVVAYKPLALLYTCYKVQ